MVTDSTLPAVRIVLQARTTSTRLPAKVLLPVGGLPLSVLAARRVARDGGDVVVATSDIPEDDLLARTLTAAGLRVVRGPLDDVLARFVIATADLDDDAICVRLTSDNPCPDADFVALLVQQMTDSGARYLAYGNDGAWLPYGLSAEACRVGDLRAAAAAGAEGHALPAAYIREHVTPSIRAAHAPAHRPPLPGLTTDHGHLRCTVDTLHDYLAMADLFADRPAPVDATWRDLVAEMAVRRPRTPAALVLGAVQLGLPYGVTRDAGLMPASTARAILTAAMNAGCVAIDTARAYGESEARIGAWLAEGHTLPVMTKLVPLDTDTDPQALTAATRASLDASCAALGRDRLDTVLLHRAAHVTDAGGAIWAELTAQVATGRIARLGVSVQTPEELLAVLAVPAVRHIQMPFNPLDWRWDGCIAALRARPDVTVHVRSVFLQGLLVQPDASRWPALPDVDATAILTALSDLARKMDRDSVADLCLAYVRAFSWIDGLVIGTDDPDQVADLTRLFARPALTWPQVAQMQRALPRATPRLLNPALWTVSA